MATVYAGSDTYGRVKSVCGTPIVTRFAMLQFLPIYPLQSLYFTKFGPTESSGIPFIAGYQSTAIQGIELARIDRMSALMAYVRSVFATLVIVGVIGVLVPGIMYLTGERLDDFAMTLLKSLLAALALGVVGGIATYLIPLTTQREREIRTVCHELLGIAIDPARVTTQSAKHVLEIAEQSQNSDDLGREKLVRDLVCIRARLAYGANIQRNESATDDILKQLRRATEHNR